MCHFCFFSVLMWLMLFYVQVNPRCQCFFCLFLCFCKHGCPHSTPNCSHRTGKRNCISEVRKPRGFFVIFFLKDRLDLFSVLFSCVAHPQGSDAHRWRLQSQSIANTQQCIRCRVLLPWMLKARKCPSHYACIDFVTILWKSLNPKKWVFTALWWRQEVRLIYGAAAI